MNSQSHYRICENQDSDLSNELLPLQVNCAGVVQCSHCHTTHIRKDFYLLYMLDNKLKLTLPTLHYEAVLACGDFIIISPQTAYDYQSFGDAAINYLWLHFTGKDAELLLKSLAIPTNTVLHIGAKQPLIDAWKKLFIEFIKKDDLFEPMSENLLQEILLHSARALKEAENLHTPEKSILYIHEHYADNFSVAELAASEGMSETQFRIHFKHATGTTPNKYITETRIRAAMNLLDTTNMHLMQIAETVGYSDAYYFGRVFKEMTGITPGKYRKKIKT